VQISMQLDLTDEETLVFLCPDRQARGPGKSAGLSCADFELDPAFVLD
jgi:hypothetical protein